MYQINRRAVEFPAESLEQVTNCPACASAEARPLYHGLTDVVFGSVSGHWCFYTCLNCGTAYLSPRPTTQSIALAYAAEYYTHVAGDDVPPRSRGLLGRLRTGLRNAYLNKVLGANTRPAIPAGHFLVTRLVPSRARRLDYTVREQDRRRGTRLLDVGCGNGEYLAQMNAAGWTTYGVEPDPKAAAVCCRRGLDVRPSLADFPGAFVDSVTLDHVVEHVHDPLNLLQGCYGALVPGGTVWIATPNVNSRGHQRFGPDWRGLEVPRHLTVLSEAALRLLLQRSGFVGIAFLPSYLAPWIYQASNELRGRRGLPMFSARDVIAWASEDEARGLGGSEELVALATKPRHERTVK